LSLTAILWLVGASSSTRRSRLLHRLQQTSQEGVGQLPRSILMPTVEHAARDRQGRRCGDKQGRKGADEQQCCSSPTSEISLKANFAESILCAGNLAVM
jgi:hypothetical protein